jgi:LPS-assembly lipoprotein
MRALRPILLMCAATLLAACGFHPLYGHSGGGPGVAENFSTVYIPPIELEGAGYELRNDLLDTMQAKSLPQGTLYDLKIDLRDRNQPIAIQNQTVMLPTGAPLKEVDITRYNYTLIADYQLIDRKTQKVLTKGTESSLSAYDVVASPYATLAAQKSAQANTAQDIAQDLRLRLGVFFNQAPAQK